MSSRSLPLKIVGILTVVSLVQHAWYWPQLPAEVATHYGIDGQPNDWMSRASAILMLCGFQIGIPFILIAVTSLASRLPNSMVNIPHRHYWLHPDRRTATLARIGNMMGWTAVMSAIFMITIGHLTFRANISGGGLDVQLFLFSLGAYLICVFTIVGHSLWHFRLPSSAA